eukprot:7549158-Karenia_brevis.AAC.1
MDLNPTQEACDLFGLGNSAATPPLNASGSSTHIAVLVSRGCKCRVVAPGAAFRKSLFIPMQSAA